jgi:uncharacterized protein YciI
LQLLLSDAGQLKYSRRRAEWRREAIIMPLYAVTYEHPDEDGWRQYLMPHVQWLQDRVKDGSLLASGPFSDLAVKSALLIMNAPDRVALDSMIASDPFAEQGLIENITIHRWDPIFGAFNDLSSMPGQKQGNID